MNLDRLVYARRVLREAIRKYGRAWTVTRTATRGSELGGRLVPEGVDVVWSSCPHQHDPRVFPEPGVFDPDRWAPARTPAATRLLPRVR
ncbi:cytochrome P450 [Streptomyces sp. KMM 9044]|uniref:cytochrome P450 n=1 Tax=Streptomyces sp. KMM 9044 TaxID=2744474 RepID=UPI003FA7DE2F